MRTCALKARFWIFALVSALQVAVLSRAPAQGLSQEEKNKAFILEFQKEQESIPGLTKVKIELDPNWPSPYTYAASKYYWQIQDVKADIENAKLIEKYNEELTKLGKPPIVVDFSKTNPYTFASAKHSDVIYPLQAEVQNSKQIQKINEMLAKVGKPPIELDMSQKFPNTHYALKNYKLMNDYNEEIHFAKQLEVLNAELAASGKPQVEVDLSKHKSYFEAYNKYYQEIQKAKNEASAKKQVEELVAAIEKAGKTVKAKLDPSKPYPFSDWKNKIFEEHPNSYMYQSHLNTKTNMSLSCADTWQSLFAKIEKKSDGAQVCEAGEDISKAIFAPSIAKALKAAAKGESEEQIRVRETATLQLVGSEANAAEIYKLRPGFADCGLSLAEIAAITAYTGSYYEALNKAMRSGNAKAYKPVIDTLNSALKKIAPHKGEVKRGVSKLGKDLGLYQPGAVVESKAFTSTAAGSGFGGTFRFTIETCSGRYIAPLSANSGEEEVLIPPGAKMKVISRKKDGDGGADIHLREVCK